MPRAVSSGELVTDQATVGTAQPTTLLRPFHEVPVSTGQLVAFSGVWRSFGRGKRRKVILRDVSLSVAPGTATCIGGQNGAGKTTLLRIANGMLTPDAGLVTVDLMSPQHNWREVHRRIGYLSAGDRGLYARLSVSGHLEFWSEIAFVPRRERKEAIDHALARFGLADLAARRADRLSQGQRQRLRLALTVVHRPKLLLLDEPQNSLDHEGLEMLAAAVGEALGRMGAVIWCSPLGEEQPIEFDRLLVLREGELTPV